MDTPSEQAPPREDAAFQSIMDALRGLRFGSVTLIVQDGVVVQVERLEKKRLQRQSSWRYDDSPDK